VWRTLFCRGGWSPTPVPQPSTDPPHTAKATPNPKHKASKAEIASEEDKRMWHGKAAALGATAAQPSIAKIKAKRFAGTRTGLFELARLFVRLDHLASSIVNADDGIMWTAVEFHVSDCIDTCIWPSIPQSPERQRLETRSGALSAVWAQVASAQGKSQVLRGEPPVTSSAPVSRQTLVPARNQRWLLPSDLLTLSTSLSTGEKNWAYLEYFGQRLAALLPLKNDVRAGKVTWGYSSRVHCERDALPTKLYPRLPAETEE